MSDVPTAHWAGLLAVVALTLTSATVPLGRSGWRPGHGALADARNLPTVDLVASSVPLLVLLDGGTSIVLPNGHRGTIDDLHRGAPVLVTGIYDQSSHILTRATRVTVLAPGS